MTPLTPIVAVARRSLGPTDGTLSRECASAHTQALRAPAGLCRLHAVRRLRNADRVAHTRCPADGHWRALCAPATILMG